MAKAINNRLAQTCNATSGHCMTETSFAEKLMKLTSASSQHGDHNACSISVQARMARNGLAARNEGHGSVNQPQAQQLCQAQSQRKTSIVAPSYQSHPQFVGHGDLYGSHLK